MSLRIIFAGTPHFALPSLQALLQSHHQLVAIFTKPDSPSGRGLKLTPTPIKQFVLEHCPQIPVLTPINLKEKAAIHQLASLQADLMVVIAYGLILPAEVLALFKYGCLNIHASLLPRWRGAAPIQRALLAGDTQTGVTIMQIDRGLDTGDILNTKPYIITASDTSKEVHAQLSTLGAQALIETLEQLELHQLKAIKQDETFATYAAKLAKEEAHIKWHNSAYQIDRQIRAFNPWPIAHTHLHDQLLKIWQASVMTSSMPAGAMPGLIIGINEKGIDVATGEGVIRLQILQIAGGKPMTASTFSQSRSKLIIPGETRLGRGEQYVSDS